MPNAANPRKWQPAPEAHVRLYSEIVQRLPGAELRRMFGYPCAFVNGLMFSGLFEDSAIVRLPENVRRDLLAGGQWTQFTPMGRPMKEYLMLPAGMFDTPDRVDEWLARGLEFTRTLPPKPAKKGKA
jgi:TfoX/Sxy family transcriptional regulator of competence genes